MDKLSTLHFMEKAKKYDEAVNSKWTKDLQNFVIEIFDLLTTGKSNRTYLSSSQACIIIKEEVKELQARVKQLETERQEIFDRFEG